jgi:hypothetical protein
MGHFHVADHNRPKYRIKPALTRALVNPCDNSSTWNQSNFPALEILWLELANVIFFSPLKMASVSCSKIEQAENVIRDTSSLIVEMTYR